MKALTALIALLTIPLVLMNWLGGIVSGIWLACLGEWKLIFIGLLVGIVGTFPISIALMPTLLFALPSAKLIERGNIALGVLFAVPATLYTVAVMSGWCYIIFSAAVSVATERTAIPLLLWSYGVATGPWSYMASKEDRGNEGFSASTMYAFFISVAYLVMVCLRLIGGADLSTCVAALLVVMGVALILQLVVSIAAMTSARQQFNQ